MKQSNESCAIPELELPVDREFNALPPRVNLKDYCRLNQEFRKRFPKGVPTEQERLARKISEEFVL
jgi:hypothetical protein